MPTFPVTSFPPDGTFVNQATLNAKINDPLTELDGRVSSAVWGDAEIASTTAQNIATGVWVKLGWASPSALAYGSGISAGSAGLIIAQPGRYLAMCNAVITGNSGGVRRLISIDTDTSADPSVSAAVDDDVPKAANQVYLSASAKINIASPNTVLTIWVFQDSGGSLSINRRALQLERIA